MTQSKTFILMPIDQALSFRGYPEETRLFPPSEMQDRADQAEAALISALQINTALNRKAYQADNYGNLANLCWSQGLLAEVGSCYDKALSLFMETGNRAKTRKDLELRDSLQATQP
jgi:tetratricopeptide (TPR) repeat protein